MEGISSENQSRVQDASLVVIFCSQLKIDEAYLTQLLDQEEADRRFRSHEARLRQEKLRQYYVGKLSADSSQNWFKHQLYIALGAFLIEAKAMGLDACPMEGFDPQKLDQIFDLKEKGLNNTVLVALGHHSKDDFNKDLQKSRLNSKRLFTNL
ncbi:hypothetical protein FAI40_02930 [Acetobacteraceae bacterium]|nr:hypothetical protein FAI40_02930 [Acetobacteraceae bacterium]